MSDVSQLRTAIRKLNVTQYSRSAPLFPGNVPHEITELQCKNKRMIVKIPLRGGRGNLALGSIIHNILTDAAVYEEAQKDYKKWCSLFSKKYSVDSQKIFDAVASNSEAFKDLIGSERYYKMIKLMNRAQGWD